ncbi:unnamed protein product [Echinostoma caproni]|uniref:Heme O synthase n=1 Tax=Echinostoma caproni TaxID=27848 RepID=A0A182ZZU8_9TREM|nr:unnamed protein product [Echinostoma caproni]
MASMAVASLFTNVPLKETVTSICDFAQQNNVRLPIPLSELTSPGRAGLFALGCASSGLLTLYLGTNPLVTALAAGNMLLYTALYTPLKQVSQANTWIGAWVGAVPPLMGWAAATGEVHSGEKEIRLMPLHTCRSNHDQCVEARGTCSDQLASFDCLLSPLGRSLH